jgi:2-dehydropantoate 2-reductase
MRIGVVGAGGVGGTIAACLAAAGHPVSVLARGEHLAAIRARGLRFVDALEAPDARGGTYAVAAGAHARELGPQDVVFLATKAHQLPALLPDIAPMLDRDTLVVPAINGLPWWYFLRLGGRMGGLSLAALDPGGVAAASVAPERIVGCVVHLAAERRAPGEVHRTAGRRLILGATGPAGSPAPPLLAPLADALRAGGFALEVSGNIRHDVWVKLIGNLSFNPIAALVGYRMDQICADEAVLDVIRPMLIEGAAVAASVGVEVGIAPDARIDIARQLGAARISMLQDLEQGRSLELAPIMGAVIELAEITGVPVPVTRIVYALALARARALGLPAA